MGRGHSISDRVFGLSPRAARSALTSAATIPVTPTAPTACAGGASARPWQSHQTLRAIGLRYPNPARDLPAWDVHGRTCLADSGQRRAVSVQPYGRHIEAFGSRRP